MAPPAALVLGGAEPTPQESAAARDAEPSKDEQKRHALRSPSRHSKRVRRVIGWPYRGQNQRALQAQQRARFRPQQTRN